MHNFASTRQLLWDRIVNWSRMVAKEIQGQRAGGPLDVVGSG
jgi:hypothetical protein